MTGEALHDKADIAAELAWRDQEIEVLKTALDEALGWNWLDEDASEDLGMRLHILANT